LGELRVSTTAVRLKLRLRVNEKSVEVIALLKSGYEAPTP
jgi:hypothetical protein